ncbi:hypothetical protein ALC60_14813 [Trachymyrmex zeteki]|uniref:Uncharacterized protein n=1 Tax=Mycetomoellerius zeteki TaxID=64791 RepID=A0A151WEI8_9HYME|nr:hypothetical protein ALC60_14813 [Trachymyrmex zeteki]
MGPKSTGAAPLKCDNFDELDELFGNKPNVIPVAIASSSGNVAQEFSDVKDSEKKQRKIASAISLSDLKMILEEKEKAKKRSLIPINCKALCVVLNLAFAGGTEDVVRHIVVDIVDRLSKLTLPNRPMEQREIPCCTIIRKSLERILVRYERIPSNLSMVVFPDRTQPTYTRAALGLLGGLYTPIDAEKCWNYLKDCYRKARNLFKKQQDVTQRSGAAKTEIIKPSFRYYNVMMFLNDTLEYIDSKKNNTSLVKKFR